MRLSFRVAAVRGKPEVPAVKSTVHNVANACFGSIAEWRVRANNSVFIGTLGHPRQLQKGAVKEKYFYEDARAGEKDPIGYTPFILWVCSEFRAGHLPVKKQLE